jgi:hypothetical protein
MTTENTRTKIEKVFTLSSYEGGMHRTKGWISDDRTTSFAESLSPLSWMIRAFSLRPLGTKIKVTMEEIN